MSKITEKIQTWLEPFLTQHHLELYYLEYVKEGKDRVLRVTLDKDGGVSSDDCAFVSGFISEQLDRDDPIQEPYVLEVTSPGIERELRTDAHLSRSIGKTVKISLFRAWEGSKSYEGELEGFSAEVMSVRVRDRIVEIPRSAISRVNIVFHFI